MTAQSPKKYRLHKASDRLPEIFGMPIKSAGVLLGSILVSAFILIADLSLRNGLISLVIIGLGIWFLRNVQEEENSVGVGTRFPKYFINDL